MHVCRLRNNETPFLSANNELMAPARDRLLVVHNWDGGTHIPSTIVDIFKKSQQTAKHVFGVSLLSPIPNSLQITAHTAGHCLSAA